MSNLTPPPLEQQVLDELLADFSLEPELVNRLLSLVFNDYPDMAVWGAKANLQRDVAQVVNASVERMESGA